MLCTQCPHRRGSEREGVGLKSLAAALVICQHTRGTASAVLVGRRCGLWRARTGRPQFKRHAETQTLSARRAASLERWTRTHTPTSRERADARTLVHAAAWPAARHGGDVDAVLARNAAHRRRRQRGRAALLAEPLRLAGPACVSVAVRVQQALSAVPTRYTMHEVGNAPWRVSRCACRTAC